MLEIPEYVNLTRQMAESLTGKHIAKGTLGNSPHKFVWYNRKPADFAAIVKGKIIQECIVEGSRSVKGLLTQDQRKVQTFNEQGSSGAAVCCV